MQRTPPPQEPFKAPENNAGNCNGNNSKCVSTLTYNVDQDNVMGEKTVCVFSHSEKVFLSIVFIDTKSN